MLLRTVHLESWLNYHTIVRKVIGPSSNQWIPWTQIKGASRCLKSFCDSRIICIFVEMCLKDPHLVSSFYVFSVCIFMYSLYVFIVCVVLEGSKNIYFDYSLKNILLLYSIHVYRSIHHEPPLFSHSNETTPACDLT